ncbi:NAD(P)H-dependent glycerol-3-phosphate dehydrogenase [Commensalibacter oyaizuii]|uniref:Glycerol-3-phosphate dehydrogenase [NAD(P)+] n=1 Tax=Commensalibacter oyaizuii TaxID=3043873 RepID=A0ABT6PYS8_9PROT|nr:NAD(P)H-dependent glycerol-3-phosphate dehydrogenase [Commensalibacter sp. TBRC 16381]MDI2090008.1 NAD(P)H-dependent glycerol-3-phosphate dehydrogenase [Commensalibacter sp. TBRC 16381]
MPINIAVIGAGAWGIALALQAQRTGANVYLWSRKELPNPETKILSRLDCIPIPPSITVSNLFPKTADLILLAVPLQHLRSILSELPDHAPLIACCKGVELNTLKFPLEILEEFFPNRLHGALSGPNFAHEVAKGYPTASVIAAKNINLAQELAETLSSPSFRLYANNDPIGVEIGGAAKNVFAIAAGAAMGAGLGENARASLITRGIAELSRLSIGLGGNPATLSGLAGLGDLILTCTGQSSRNYSLGVELGQGKKLHDILQNRTTVAEGVTTAPAILQRAKNHHIDTPIIEMVSELLNEKITVKDAQHILMARPLNNE